jgi:hypothetical protein
MSSAEPVCPSCAHANPAGSRFCNRCGAPVDFRACGACDAVNATAAAQCHKCGAPLAVATPTRTITAATATTTSIVLALAGLVGLSALLFFAYQEDPQAAGPEPALLPIETIAFVERDPAVVDAASEDKLRTTLLTAPRAAAKPAKASAKPRKPAPAKPKPRSLVRN